MNRTETKAARPPKGTTPAKRVKDKVIKGKIGTGGGASTPTPPPRQTTGGRMLAGMREVLDTLKAGGMPAVEKKFTVRRVKVAKLRAAPLTAADAAGVRASMGVSQAVFAAWLGVSPSTVQGWEQGATPPAGPAARVLSEMKLDPDHWRHRLSADLAAAD
jgi:putative transcriptional regulator